MLTGQARCVRLSGQPWCVAGEHERSEAVMLHVLSAIHFFVADRRDTGDPDQPDDLGQPVAGELPLEERGIIRCFLGADTHQPGGWFSHRQQYAIDDVPLTSAVHRGDAEAKQLLGHVSAYFQLDLQEQAKVIHLVKMSGGVDLRPGGTVDDQCSGHGWFLGFETLGVSVVVRDVRFRFFFSLYLKVENKE